MWGHCYITFSLKPKTIGLTLALILESKLYVSYHRYQHLGSKIFHSFL